MNLETFLNAYNNGSSLKILLYNENKKHICDFYNDSLGISPYRFYDVVNFRVINMHGSMPTMSVCINTYGEEGDEKNER